MRPRSVVLALAAAFLCVASASAAEYRLTPIGNLGGPTWGRAINDNGQIVGYGGPCCGSLCDVFLWTPVDGMQTLKKPGRFPLLPETNLHATPEDLNNAGQILLNVTGGEPCIWDPVTGLTTVEQLFGLAVPGERFSAVAFNERGQVLCNAEWTAPVRHHRAYLLDPDLGLVDVGSLGGGDTVASDLNEAGQVVGWSWLPPPDPDVSRYGSQHAFLWDQAAGMVDLGALADHGSEAVAINNAGQVLGYSDDAEGHRRSVLWSQETGMVTVGSAIQYTEGDSFLEITDWDFHVIGDNGLIGGYKNIDRFSMPVLQNLLTSFRAVLWQDNAEVDLNDKIFTGSGWTLTDVEAINNQGQILCYAARTSDLEWQVVLLTPIQPGDDTDGDGQPDPSDNCPDHPNNDQEDTDRDGVGNVCDNCPLLVNTDQSNVDGDAVGDACDDDDDGDGIADTLDNCPSVSNPNQADQDSDGDGDTCDLDYFGDAVADNSRFYLCGIGLPQCCSICLMLLAGMRFVNARWCRRWH